MTYTLRDFGSYTAGGRLHHVREGTPREVNFTKTASFMYDPRGHFAVEQTYVQYFVPEQRRDAPPMILLHGGGMHGGSWETTPDGRPGWLHLLLDRGYEVHVVDLVERGRSGFMLDLWDDEPILRSAEEAWGLFRFGPMDGYCGRQTFPDLKFPIDAFDVFQQGIVPRWLTTNGVQLAGVLAVLDRLAEATLICHSQSGEIAFEAARLRSDKVRAVLAVEPSAFPAAELKVPLTILAGDYLDAAPHWVDRSASWYTTTAAVRAQGGTATCLDTVAQIAPGGSHFMMMDYHAADVLALGLEELGL
ncbi:MAG: hypothetical protein AAF376_09490 [Pseudomonadota bacterium]